MKTITYYKLLAATKTKDLVLGVYLDKSLAKARVVAAKKGRIKGWNYQEYKLHEIVRERMDPDVFFM